MFFLSSQPARRLYHTESLKPPGHPVTNAVTKTATRERYSTLSSTNTNSHTNSRPLQVCPANHSLRKKTMFKRCYIEGTESSVRQTCIVSDLRVQLRCRRDLGCFWEIPQGGVAILYRRLGTSYRSHLQGARSPTIVSLILSPK